MTTELDFVCGFVEKLSLRIGAGVGDVAGVGVVELHFTSQFGASRCNVGAELPICITSDVGDAFFTNVTVPLVDGFDVAIRFVL